MTAPPSDPLGPLRDLIRAYAAAPGPKTWVYFLQAGPSDGPIKIGTGKRVRSRLKSLQTGNAQPIYVLAVVPGDARVEGALHRHFAGSRLHGEWFAPTDELRALVRECAVRYAYQPELAVLRREGRVRYG